MEFQELSTNNSTVSIQYLPRASANCIMLMMNSMPTRMKMDINNSQTSRKLETLKLDTHKIITNQ